MHTEKLVNSWTRINSWLEFIFNTKVFEFSVSHLNYFPKQPYLDENLEKESRELRVKCLSHLWSFMSQSGILVQIHFHCPLKQVCWTVKRNTDTAVVTVETETSGKWRRLQRFSCHCYRAQKRLSVKHWRKYQKVFEMDYDYLFVFHFSLWHLTVLFFLYIMLLEMPHTQ